MAHPTRSGANGQHPGETGRSWHRMTVLTGQLTGDSFCGACSREEGKISRCPPVLRFRLAGKDNGY